MVDSKIDPLEERDLPWLKGKNKGKAAEIARHFTEIMKVLELDLSDPHLQETPERVGRMYLEIFRGLEDLHEPAITTFPNSEGYKNMVIVKEIEFYSVCSHHMIPFFGKAHVAYIPDQAIVGLSKIARIVEFYARRPQLQERLTEQVVDFIEAKLAPKGSIVVMEARHLCMEMRGVEKTGAMTSTSALRGCFEDQKVREEFFDLLQRD
ncbi:MAG: GTP cyclohydrolase I FolE [Candidatus Latescibacterota bacterium]